VNPRTYGSLPVVLNMSVPLATNPQVFTSTIHYVSNAFGAYPVSNEATVTLDVVTPNATYPPPTPGAIPPAIANANLSAYTNQMDSYNAPGTLHGAYACAWAVNQILVKAGLSPLGVNQIFVPSMEISLLGGRGVQINQRDTIPGDLVIENRQNHIGICANLGCSEVYSNDTSHHNYTQNTDPMMGYHFGPSRFWRVIK